MPSQLAPRDDSWTAFEPVYHTIDEVQAKLEKIEVCEEIMTGKSVKKKAKEKAKDAPPKKRSWKERKKENGGYINDNPHASCARSTVATRTRMAQSRASKTSCLRIVPTRIRSLSSARRSGTGTTKRN